MIYAQRRESVRPLASLAPLALGNDFRSSFFMASFTNFICSFRRKDRVSGVGQRYSGVKRHSGGGECAGVKLNAGGKVYLRGEQSSDADQYAGGQRYSGGEE